MKPTATQAKLMEQTGASLDHVIVTLDETNTHAANAQNAGIIEQKLLAMCKDNFPLLEETWRLLTKDFQIANRDRAGLLRHFRTVEKAQMQLPYVIEMARANLKAAEPPPPAPRFHYFNEDAAGLEGAVDANVTPAAFMAELKAMAFVKGIALQGNINIECSIGAYPLIKHVMDEYSLKPPTLNIELDNTAFRVKSPEKTKAAKG